MSGKIFTPDCRDCKFCKRRIMFPFDRDMDLCQNASVDSEYCKRGRQRNYTCGMKGKFFVAKTSRIRRFINFFIRVPSNDMPIVEYEDAPAPEFDFEHKPPKDGAYLN